MSKNYDSCRFTSSRDDAIFDWVKFSLRSWNFSFKLQKLSWIFKKSHDIILINPTLRAENQAEFEIQRLKFKRVEQPSRVKTI